MSYIYNQVIAVNNQLTTAKSNILYYTSDTVITAKIGTTDLPAIQKIVNGVTYNCYVFTASGTISANRNTLAIALLVGGGGGAGYSYGGSGGGGGGVSEHVFIIPTSSTNVTVGGGGSGGVGGNTYTSGTSSTIDAISGTFPVPQRVSYGGGAAGGASGNGYAGVASQLGDRGGAGGGAGGAAGWNLQGDNTASGGPGYFSSIGPYITTGTTYKDAFFSGTISGTTLTIGNNKFYSGKLVNGMQVWGTGVTSGTTIVSQTGYGTAANSAYAGFTGTYTLSTTSNVSAETSMAARMGDKAGWGGGGCGGYNMYGSSSGGALGGGGDNSSGNLNVTRTGGGLYGAVNTGGGGSSAVNTGGPGGYGGSGIVIIQVQIS